MVKVESRRFKTEVSEVWMDEEGILILKFLKDDEVDLEEVKACFKVYGEMGINPKNKVLQLIDARHHAMPNSEARDLAAKMGKDYFLASAVVSNSIAIRLIVNFFNSFYKSEVPFKMFGDEAAARKWLKSFKKTIF